MDNLEKKFNNAKEVNLSSGEKEKIKSFLVSYIKTRPDTGAHGAFLAYFALPHSRSMSAAFAVFIILAGSAGASFAAEGSLPGDLLYPVKVSINEEVRGALARSQEDKVNWLVIVAERRIEETEKLASQNRLDERSRAKIEASFDKKSKELQEKLSELGNDELRIAADVTSRLETSLIAHEEILGRLGESSESKTEIFSLLKNVKSVSQSVKETRKSFEDEIFASRSSRLDVAVEARLNTSVESINRAKKTLEDRGNLADSEVRAKAEALIKEAEEMLLAARSQSNGAASMSMEDVGIATMSLEVASSTVATTTETEVLTKLHEAIKLSNQAKIILEAQANLNLKVLDFQTPAPLPVD